MAIILAVIGGLALGIGAALLILARARKTQLSETEQKCQHMLAEAAERNRLVELETKDEIERFQKKNREEFEKETREKRNELKKLEERLVRKEENVDRKGDRILERENDIGRREDEFRRKEQMVEEQARIYAGKIASVNTELERIAGLTKEQAKTELVSTIETEARQDSARIIKQIEDETREESEKRSKRILGIAMQRYAGEYSTERAVSVVNLPSDDMKGRIIGREGRNIRAIEAATGCDLIIDDTPEAVIISSFNPVRREIARLSLEKLIQDGRIHPSRIEEIVVAVTADVEKEIKEAGEQAAFELGLHGIHAELIKLIGRLKFRYSYAQNVWTHSVECGFLAGIMAGELNLNVKIARRAALLHDIGKAVDHEIEGSHAIIGANLAKKYGERPEIVNAIASHHEDTTQDTVYAHLVAAADALSGARPGARREMLESYVQRLENLEKISKSFSGVGKSYAIQAGREVRVLVEHSQVDDAGALMLARDIARKIEEELTYPGQIKVCVIRETRAVEFAR